MDKYKVLANTVLRSHISNVHLSVLKHAYDSGEYTGHKDHSYEI
jgi:hypothetical protein